MCGIVGAISRKNVTPQLIDGLKRLEYRGYDSAGVAVLDSDNQLHRIRREGKVHLLENPIEASSLAGTLGIAHTRWATHGAPARNNAHPHIANNRVAIVHNGIIENHAALHKQQQQQGFTFTSETDTETVVHQIEHYLKQEENLQQVSLTEAVHRCMDDLEGAYALGVISPQQPDLLVAARWGSPLVIGIGEDEHYIASDSAALLPLTNQFIYLEDGDLAEIRCDSLTIIDQSGAVIERPIHTSKLSADNTELGPYAHYMLKEIYEQPIAIADTLEGRIYKGEIMDGIFGHEANATFEQIEQIQILACGTSYHAGMVARYWIERLLQMPCAVEVASEFRYRQPVIRNNTLTVALSQSGETADTLAALKEVKKRGFLQTLTICNVPESSLVRESALTLMTHAGPEIGVASTKAFTTQLVALLLLSLSIGKAQNSISREDSSEIIHALERLPRQIEQVLTHDQPIQEMATAFADKEHALFLGRNRMYPIAMEGSLKLKEISYIHAEAYPAGELKHGPLALVDANMPIVVVAPSDQLMDKLRSNMEEVKSRKGALFVFTDSASHFEGSEQIHTMAVTEPASNYTAPILFTIPLQLLAYHVALIKGTDVDQPRNLAKSVTVE
ncbi:MAG: glutamine--fructose-6-phosphate transaminase (isomerizing) [Gammaproteobacteria bacterium]|nr:glutamine--fructose-6-phosphate transaminase (isomerizing) [Gammaproteobacteria bacterium]MBT4788627.1 glutamine--fructose-6-phosphate transaminase (isomerizing) [Gammaproteobacteria bacterium]MBT5688186.1 glutamine--fructose-6-phosphate transaminase (isomerizing) [Gammaproteobacteria bacterium]MBT6880566.1 glutamine--fructose-6-phosphate transaminase (isomerizing) [Gammaproteobacteria bacterium]MBT7479955.1 glutamine--fructose-6-phosphate transaminase (isomerizing) [Gammaproteobacteria bact